MDTKKLCILGSTGSIGTQALEVAKHLDIEVDALCAHSNVKLLEEISAFKARLSGFNVLIKNFDDRKAALEDELKEKNALMAANDEKLKEMVDFIFNFQMKTLGVDYIDCYLLHALDDTQYSDNNYLTKDLYIRLYKILLGYKEKGLIKHLGFSAHIGFYRMFYLCEEFKKALGEGVIDVAEVSYNILNDKGHTQKEPCYFAKQYGVMVWDAIGEEGIKYLKDNGYFVIDMMPHESGRIGQISTAEDWFRWADRFALNNKNIDVVLEGTSYIPHFQMMLEEAGVLKRDIQEMRDIEGTSHRCHE